MTPDPDSEFRTLRLRALLVPTDKNLEAMWAETDELDAEALGVLTMLDMFIMLCGEDEARALGLSYWVLVNKLSAAPELPTLGWEGLVEKFLATPPGEWDNREV